MAATSIALTLAFDLHPGHSLFGGLPQIQKQAFLNPVGPSQDLLIADPRPPSVRNHSLLVLFWVQKKIGRIAIH